MEETTNTTEARDIMALGSALSDPLTAKAPSPGESAPYVVVPEGYSVENLEDLFPAPMRARGTYKLMDCASFIALVNDLRTSATRVYGIQTPPSFRAVFNDNMGADGPGWGDHMAVYTAPLSVEWKTWTGKNGAQMMQADFARFIEDNALDIVAPSSADMIEISRTIEAKKKVNFASGLRLDNGQTQITYEEEIQGTAAKGKFQIPETFDIGVSVLEGGPRYRVTARLRYRIDDGKLMLWYDLLRPHKIIEDAVKHVRAEIALETGMMVFNGDPR